MLMRTNVAPSRDKLVTPPINAPFLTWTNSRRTNISDTSRAGLSMEPRTVTLIQFCAAYAPVRGVGTYTKMFHTAVERGR